MPITLKEVITTKPEEVMITPSTTTMVVDLPPVTAPLRWRFQFTIITNTRDHLDHLVDHHHRRLTLININHEVERCTRTMIFASMR